MTEEVKFPIKVQVHDDEQERCAKILNGICLHLDIERGWKEGSRNDLSVNIDICLHSLGLFEEDELAPDVFSKWMSQQDWSRVGDIDDYISRKDVISKYVDSWYDDIDLYGFCPNLYEDFYDNVKEKGGDADVIVVAVENF